MGFALIGETHVDTTGGGRFAWWKTTSGGTAFAFTNWQRGADYWRVAVAEAAHEVREIFTKRAKAARWFDPFRLPLVLALPHVVERAARPWRAQARADRLHTMRWKRRRRLHAMRQE